MEVALATNFDFNSSSYSDGYYASAPSSPARLTEMYCEFDELLIASMGTNCRDSIATVPFAWEEKPGVPKTPKTEDDFSFDVSCHFDFDSVPAEDLFQGGRIKTIDIDHVSAKNKKIERESRESRGRERGFSTSSRLPSRRTRSLSPLGASDYRREQRQPTAVNTKPTPSTCSGETGSRKWSFKDLFLFRSASDGRAMDKDPLKKYSTVLRKHDQDFTNSCEPGSMSKRRGRVSAHGLHYNLNRAVSNDMKKKTYLPYKQGILGGLSFNP